VTLSTRFGALERRTFALKYDAVDFAEREISFRSWNLTVCYHHDS